MNRSDVDNAFAPFGRPVTRRRLAVFSAGIATIALLEGALFGAVWAARDTHPLVLALGWPLLLLVLLLFFPLFRLTDRLTDATVPVDLVARLCAALRSSALNELQRAHIEVWAAALPATVKYSHVDALQEQLRRLATPLASTQRIAA